MKENRSVIIWLLVGCLLIFIMVIIGGITRLTHSGLSMVNWNLFMGAIPPLNEVEWQETFNLYKQSPEFQKVNFNYTLSEFKSIFVEKEIFTPSNNLISANGWMVCDPS